MPHASLFNSPGNKAKRLPQNELFDTRHLFNFNKNPKV